MEVLAMIKSVSQTIQGKPREDGTVSTRKIVEFQIGDKSLHITVFRGLDRYQVGMVGMLSYSVSSEIRTARETGDPWVSYNVAMDSFRVATQQNVQAPSQEPSHHEVAEEFAEMAEMAAQVAINPETGIPF